MATDQARRARVGAVALALLALSGLTAGCAALRSGLEPPSEREKGGEEHKRWSGRSFLAETRVEARPRRSASSSSFDAERVWSGNDDWEPALAVDPGSSWVYMLTTRYGAPDCTGCSTANIAFRRSKDGGATWDPDGRIFDSKLGQFDPLIEVSAGGTVFAAFMLSYTPGVMVTRSDDHGTTWSKPVAMGSRLRNPWSDKPVLTVSPDGRDVYVAFNTSNSYVAASHDGGLSFADPVKTNSDRRYWYHYQGAVAPDGTVYFAAIDTQEDFIGDQHVDVLRSGDGGKSWTTQRLDTSAEVPDCAWAAGCYPGFLSATAALAVDSAGTVMFAYSSSAIDQGPYQVFVRTSKDGLAWSERQAVTAETPWVMALFPVLAAGPQPGDFRIAWQDDRNGSTNAWNTWYRATSDGGLTWSAETRLSDQGTGAPYKTDAGYTFPYGDYLEMAVDSSGMTHAVWGEGESWDGPGGSWFMRGR